MQSSVSANSREEYLEAKIRRKEEDSILRYHSDEELSKKGIEFKTDDVFCKEAAEIR